MEPIVNAVRGYTIYIGHEGDALGTVVEFDMSRPYAQFGGGTFAVLVRRPREKESYPAAEVTYTDGKVRWTVSAVDAAMSGEGEVQVLYTNGERVLHSEKFKTNIKTSLDGGANPPEEVIPYITAIEKAVAKAEIEANKANESADNALISEQNAAESERNAAESEQNVNAKDIEIHAFVNRSKTEIAEETQGAVELIERTTDQAIGDAKYEIGTEASTTKDDIRVFGWQIKEELNISAQEAAESARMAQQLAQSVRNDADAGKFNGARGPQGIQGPKGDTGSDANVTAFNIRNALGYLPISELSLNPYAKKTYVDEAVSSIKLCVIALQLPTTGEPNKIYLIRRTDPEENNVFDEYLWIQSKWEHIGKMQAEIDLNAIPNDESLLIEYGDPDFHTKLQAAYDKGVKNIFCHVVNGTTGTDNHYYYTASNVVLVPSVNAYIIQFNLVGAMGIDTFSVNRMNGRTTWGTPSKITKIRLGSTDLTETTLKQLIALLDES